MDHARSLGIDIVYQDLALINELTVYHNMFLNRETVRWPLLSNRAMRTDGPGAPGPDGGRDPESVDVEVAKLSGGQRQAIAVARSVSSDAKVLLLDEPLAAMGAKEGGDDPGPGHATSSGRARSRSSSSRTTTARCSRCATG